MIEFLQGCHCCASSLSCWHYQALVLSLAAISQVPLLCGPVTWLKLVGMGFSFQPV